MSDQRTARHYAEALFQAGEAAGQIERVAGELEAVTSMIEDPQFRGFFVSDKVDVETKKSVFNKAFIREISTLTRNFFWLVFDNGRETLLDAIRNEFDALLDAQRRRAIVRLVSAVELSAELKTKIAQRLAEATGKEIVLEPLVDPEVQGGLLIRLDDRMIDATLRGRLGEMREGMTDAR